MARLTLYVRGDRVITPGHTLGQVAAVLEAGPDPLYEVWCGDAGNFRLRASQPRRADERSQAQRELYQAALSGGLLFLVLSLASVSLPAARPVAWVPGLIGVVAAGVALAIRLRYGPTWRW